eukprot:4927281-Prymnesium_polylepis.1
MMPYVSKQKRKRIINPDETHLLLSTELEKGGPRASVYVLGPHPGCRRQADRHQLAPHLDDARHQRPPR